MNYFVYPILFFISSISIHAQTPDNSQREDVKRFSPQELKNRALKITKESLKGADASLASESDEGAEDDEDDEFETDNTDINNFNNVKETIFLKNEAIEKISDRYFKGRFLVFECRDNHFACIDYESNELCKRLRANEIKENVLEYSCAPLKEYKDQNECKKAMYGLIHKKTGSRFCFPSIKK